MKSLSLVGRYRDLIETANDFVYEKLNLEEVSNDYVFFVVMNLAESPTKGLIRIILDRVIDTGTSLEWDGSYYYDTSASELDTFISSGKVEEVLNYESLVDMSPPEEELEEDEQFEEPVKIGH